MARALLDVDVSSTAHTQICRHSRRGTCSDCPLSARQSTETPASIQALLIPSHPQQRDKYLTNWYTHVELQETRWFHVSLGIVETSTPAQEKTHLAIVHVFGLRIHLSTREGRTLRVPEVSLFTFVLDDTTILSVVRLSLA